MTVCRDAKARLANARSRAHQSYGGSADSAGVREGDGLSSDSAEYSAVRKASEALRAPLSAASSWGQGHVQSECDGKCPICKKVRQVEEYESTGRQVELLKMGKSFFGRYVIGSSVVLASLYWLFRIS